MSTLPPYRKCNSALTYEDDGQLVCPESDHEWSASATAEAADKGLTSAMYMAIG